MALVGGADARCHDGVTSGDRTTGIDLYWIPLGAGGSGFVRFNGRVYEAITARRRGGRRAHLLHTALRVHVPEGSFVVETVWPSPDRRTQERGVAREGPVAHPTLACSRVFRYEVRRWRDGSLPDEDQAIGGPRRVSDDPAQAHRLLDAVPSMPVLTWGRDEAGAGEMWNSNSVISWLLFESGVSLDRCIAPPGCRAPGWDAGVLVARGSRPLDAHGTGASSGGR
ncbi:MAG TPA: hypothetical protein VLB67_15735 [Acidimicrobiia bacterium]|nr:hypothetical protein [Acidimicrobiia bacterium]